VVNGRLLTADEAAELLAVPVSWVRESTRGGAMPVVELGRYRRYRREDVEAWLASCSRPGRAIGLRSVREHGDNAPLPTARRRRVRR
jgi:excisionase family DNA binding protein